MGEKWRLFTLRPFGSRPWSELEKNLTCIILHKTIGIGLSDDMFYFFCQTLVDSTYLRISLKKLKVLLSDLGNDNVTDIWKSRGSLRPLCCLVEPTELICHRIVVSSILHASKARVGLLSSTISRKYLFPLKKYLAHDNNEIKSSAMSTPNVSQKIILCIIRSFVIRKNRCLLTVFISMCQVANTILKHQFCWHLC